MLCFSTQSGDRSVCGCLLSGPLNRLNAILSLLHPLDRPCDRECDWEGPYLALSRIQNTGGSPQPHRSKPLGGLDRAIVALQCLKPLENKCETKTR